MLAWPPSLHIQHGLESRALSANTPSQHKQRGGYALRLAHQPILSCAIRSVLMSLWTHSYGINSAQPPTFLHLDHCLSDALSSFCRLYHCAFSPVTSQYTLIEAYENSVISNRHQVKNRLDWLDSKTNLCSLINSMHKGHPQDRGSHCTKTQLVPVVLSCNMSSDDTADREEHRETLKGKTNCEAWYGGSIEQRGNRD